jgi:IPT/TIG domain/PASTA domain
VTRARLLAILLANASLTVAVAGTASAAVVTVGAQMGGETWESAVPGELEAPFALFNRSKTQASSPVTGAIIGWNVREAVGGPFHLRVLRPVGGGGYAGAGTSAGVSPLTTGLEHFAADLPIQAGDTVGLDYAHATDKIGLRIFFEPNPPTFSYFASALPEGGTSTPIDVPIIGEIGFEIGFNAEVQPAPSVTAIGTTEGPAAGGSTVVITGTDLEGAVVHFGSAAATSSPISESSLSVTVPPGPPSTSVPISVTTVAGTATAPATFFYQPLPKGPGGPEEPGTPENPGTPEQPGTPEEPGGTAGPSSPAAGGSSTSGTSTPSTPTPTSATSSPHCTAPKLTATKLKAAKKKAAAADCRIGKVTKAKTVKTGKVVAQSPKPGIVLAAGSRVNVKLG